MTAWASIRAVLPTNRGSACEGNRDSCRCKPTFERRAEDRVDDDVVLSIDAGECPGGGDLARSPNCRATAIDALSERDAAVVRTFSMGANVPTKTTQRHCCWLPVGSSNR